MTAMMIPQLTDQKLTSGYSLSGDMRGFVLLAGLKRAECIFRQSYRFLIFVFHDIYRVKFIKVFRQL